MASSSEYSFGARLRKAQDMATFIAGFTAYDPPRSEEQVVNFNVFLSTIVECNSTETTYKQNYNAAVITRYNAFRVDDFSLFKLLAPIRNIVLAQYGKDSIEFKQVDTIIAKIRSSKLIKTIVGENIVEASISQSEQSYGSSTQFFNDLVNTLETFPNYKPSKDELKLDKLKDFRNSLTTLNNAVASNYQKINEVRNKRRVLYEELTDRTQRIKAYVKGNYGTLSQEYKLIKGLRI